MDAIPPPSSLSNPTLHAQTVARTAPSPRLLVALLRALAKRGIDRDTLVENAEVVAAGRFILEMSSASHVLVY